MWKNLLGWLWPLWAWIIVSSLKLSMEEGDSCSDVHGLLAGPNTGLLPAPAPAQPAHAQGTPVRAAGNWKISQGSIHQSSSGNGWGRRRVPGAPHISYLAPCNKSSQNLAAGNNTHLSLYNFCPSESQMWLSSVPLAQALSGDFSQTVSQSCGFIQRLGWSRGDPFSSSLMLLKNVLLDTWTSPWSCLTTWKLDSPRMSDPRESEHPRWDLFFFIS